LKFANVVVDISLQKLDKTFEYIVPGELEGELRVGMKVAVPFGHREMTGFVLELTEQAKLPIEKLKEIIRIEEKSVPIEFELIELATFMKHRYGCTMNQALKTVLPSKKRVATRAKKVKQVELPEFTGEKLKLNDEQQKVRDGILKIYPKTSLLYGITGSGKTEVYMELIDAMLNEGKQVILLIPEISLTLQNVRRFYARFGDKLGIVNSRLSAGEKFEVFDKASRGDVQIMIGPRSALFTPFPKLGMIIADEEHETAYFSETSPRYNTVEVAIKRAEISGAQVVLGSATPRVEDYMKAEQGEYGLFNLTSRAVPGSVLPQVEIVDMRQELLDGNKSIFSRALTDAINDRLAKKQQVMLFLNRRGYSNYMWCLSCGKPIKCPHCDVSMPSHYGYKLMCHYCGHVIPQPKACPSCGSAYLAHRGAGTEKVETVVKKLFPSANVVRMDADTTTGKAGHSKLIEKFSSGGADILIGTQMIVKGHDFPKVTLVGIIAAERSLNSDDLRASERTFQLLTQAAGRAGRAGDMGSVIIQTYVPENEVINQAARQDYKAFYADEIAYRRLMKYPPAGAMLSVLMTSADDAGLHREAQRICGEIVKRFKPEGIELIGPSDSGIRKIEDKFRCGFYIKHESDELLIRIRDFVEENTIGVTLQIDLL